MKTKKYFSTFYLGFVLILLYLPIAFVVLYSFNASKSSAVWGGFTLEWYAKMANDRDLLAALWVSVKVAFFSAVIAVVIGTLGAVALDKLNKKLKTFITGLSYIPLIIPEIVLGVALLMFFSVTPLRHGMVTLVISHSAFCIPYVLLMVQVRLAGIDPSITEAAIDLGAKRRQLFTTITLPLILPSIVSGTLLAVAMSLDDVIISFFVSGPGTTTLPIKILSLLKLGITPKINALCTLLLLFTFISVGILTHIEGYNIKRKEDE